MTSGPIPSAGMAAILYSRMGILPCGSLSVTASRRPFLGLSPPLGGSGQQQLDLFLFGIGLVGQVAAPTLEGPLAFALLFGPHPTHVAARRPKPIPRDILKRALRLAWAIPPSHSPVIVKRSAIHHRFQNAASARQCRALAIEYLRNRSSQNSATLPHAAMFRRSGL
jgi:hypothetical protein